MTSKRASSVRPSSARAEKRNTCSGGSSFGSPPGSPAAAAPAANAMDAATSAMRHRQSAGARLIFQPAHVRTVTATDRNRDDLRQLVVMKLADRRLDLVV